MEVHAHTHTEGKRLKHYLFEFFMLFLAVFAGFLAENFREHQIEKQREKQYIQSMIEDLEADTTNLDISISNYLIREKYFDTLLNLFHDISHGYNLTLRTNLGKIMGYYDFIPTDKTLQQLKNSGGMRLIRNEKASDGIAIYDSKMKDLENTMKELNRVFSMLDDCIAEIIDNESLKYDSQNMTIGQIQNGTKNYLLKDDKATLGKFYNRIVIFRFIKKLFYNGMLKIKIQATKLIALLKKEYHLE